MGIALMTGVMLFFAFLPFTIGFLIGIIVMLWKWFHEKKAVTLALAAISFVGMLFFGALAGLGLWVALGVASYGGLLGN